MKVLHLNAGNETGGGMHHILALLQQLNHDRYILGVLERHEMYERAQDLGIHTVHFPHRFKWNPILLKEIQQFIFQNNIKILHSHGPRANVYANILQRFIPIHWVVTVHSDPRKDFLGQGIYGKLLSYINIQSLKNAHQMVAISDPLKRYLKTLNIPGRKITCTYNGIDFREKSFAYHTRKRFGFTKKDFIFLMVGRLEKVKDHATAFYAFEKVLRKHNNCHLILVGDGSQKLQLKLLAVQLNIEKHVHFYGYHRDVTRFYEIADVKLLTSLSESFPLVLLEAARSKLPIISTNVGSISRLINNQSSGWLVQPKNVELLAEVMNRVLSYNESHLRQRGKALYEYAKKRFSLESFANRMKEIYNQSTVFHGD